MCRKRTNHLFLTPTHSHLCPIEQSFNDVTCSFYTITEPDLRILRFFLSSRTKTLHKTLVLDVLNDYRLHINYSFSLISSNENLRPPLYLLTTVHPNMTISNQNRQNDWRCTWAVLPLTIYSFLDPSSVMDPSLVLCKHSTVKNKRMKHIYWDGEKRTHTFIRGFRQGFSEF